MLPLKWHTLSLKEKSSTLEKLLFFLKSSLQWVGLVMVSVTIIVYDLSTYDSIPEWCCEWSVLCASTVIVSGGPDSYGALVDIHHEAAWSCSEKN